LLGEIELECPFCGKAKVKVFHKEGYMQAKTSRISAGARVTRHAVSDYYEILEDCPNCGAKRKNMQDFFEGKYKKKISHEERIEMLKKRGLPLIVGSGWL
jgi:sarcosine oxidase delta subunit